MFKNKAARLEFHHFGRRVWESIIMMRSRTWLRQCYRTGFHSRQDKPINFTSACMFVQIHQLISLLSPTCWHGFNIWKKNFIYWYQLDINCIYTKEQRRNQEGAHCSEDTVRRSAANTFSTPNISIQWSNLPSYVPISNRVPLFSNLKKSSTERKL